MKLAFTMWEVVGSSELAQIKKCCMRHPQLFRAISVKPPRGILLYAHASMKGVDLKTDCCN